MDSKKDPYPIHTITPLTQNDPWPKIWDVQSRPEKIFVRGSSQVLEALLPRLPEWGLAVVGTRHPQARSVALIRREIGKLQGSRLILLSGLARGIDTEAHEAALQAGIPTIAILAGGVDLPYPRRNLELSQRILSQGGLLISEFPPGSPPKPWNFLQRNRLIAGWSSATWVVEAGYRSGALNTAKWAREHHRDTYATPCFPGEPALAGNQMLLDRDHAIPFWGSSQLGSTWLEMATHASRFAPSADSKPLPDSALPQALLWEIRERTRTDGGVRPDALLNWAIENRHEPSKFFQDLQTAIQSGWVNEVSGVLVSVHE